VEQQVTAEGESQPVRLAATVTPAGSLPMGGSDGPLWMAFGLSLASAGGVVGGLWWALRRSPA